MVLNTMLDSANSRASTSAPSRPFVYISAEDAFRPFVPRRYIETKRQAEIEIGRLCSNTPEAGIRPIYMRPGELCVLKTILLCPV